MWSISLCEKHIALCCPVWNSFATCVPLSFAVCDIWKQTGVFMLAWSAHVKHISMLKHIALCCPVGNEFATCVPLSFAVCDIWEQQLALQLHEFALQHSRVCLCVAVAMARTKKALKNNPQAPVPRQVQKYRQKNGNIKPHRATGQTCWVRRNIFNEHSIYIYIHKTLMLCLGGSRIVFWICLWCHSNSKFEIKRKTKKASGKRKKGINPKTGRSYARRKSGMIQTVWPAQLMHKKNGIYRCKITEKGKHIVVTDLENELYWVSRRSRSNKGFARFGLQNIWTTPNISQWHIQACISIWLHRCWVHI